MNFDYYKLEAVKHFGTNLTNTEIAKLIIVDKSELSLETLRKKIGILKSKKVGLEPYLTGNPNNILIIGDLHAPFTLPKYLDFCLEQQRKYQCGKVIFIGDIIDNHYSSYHESDPDGMSAGAELDKAINDIQAYYKAFPVATVIIGNHDRLVHRKAFSGGVSKRWVKEYNEVLKVPNWDFVENVDIFNVNINHGEGGTARTKMKKELQSQIQGHLHSDFYIEYIVGKNFRIFGMQIGSGVDHKSYAMSYGRNFKKPAIGCGVLLNKGTLPIIIPMIL